MIVAIDGPSGSGKSSIAHAIADRFGLTFLDTGAMYRSVAAECLRLGVDPEDSVAVAEVARETVIEFGTSEAGQTVTANGRDVTAEIRTPEVELAVSPVSANPAVREVMVSLQRKVGETGDVVAEGRDIGTVVFPNAQVKVFLTADPRERARRRVLQRHQNDAQPLTSEQLEAEVDETLDALKQRDKLDSSREVAPLVPAEDAVHVDSTAHTIDEVVRIIEGLINQRR